jgi:Uma2 family endonuclease
MRFQRLTFVAGELIIDMSPELFEAHNFPKTEITAVLYQRARELRIGRLFSDRSLFSNPSAGISTEPDAMLVTYASLRTGRSRVQPSDRAGVSEELVGSPDWILEIISPSSRRKDAKLLRDAYFTAGIPEYWLTDVLGEDIDFQILVRGEHSYVAVEPRDGWLASPTFGCSFRLTREKDEDGFWQYTLHVQEKS